MKKPREKKEPFKFTWMKYEVPILIILLVIWCTYILIDFGLLMRSLVVNPKIKIHGLDPGYFGLQRDAYDSQWHHWRESLDILLLVAVLHLGIGFVLKKNAQQDIDKSTILAYNMVFGVIFVGYIERAGFFYWLLLTGIFFTVTQFGYKWKAYPYILWSLALTTLYFNETYGGYGFLFISEKLRPLHDSLHHAPVRWNIIFNMTLLRIISFGMDYHWSYKQGTIAQNSKETLSYKQRQEVHQPLKNYNLFTYYSYLLYIPLFLTGPIISFNAWISQIHIPQVEYSRKALVDYGVKKLLFVFLTFEIFLHFFYVNAISRHPKNLDIWLNNFLPHHLFLMSILILFFLWFKFLIIWRFARFWALLDGIESPENMNRCVVDNYSFEGFWRSWHRSFNQWLIRYIYIPLGGNKCKFLNIFVVFGFVAIWHDMVLDLIVWSMVICLTLVVEMGIRGQFLKEKRRYLWSKIWFRYLSATVSVLVVASMVISNLIGYGVGYNGIIHMRDIMIKNGYSTALLATIGVSIVNNNISFRLREVEEESGNAKKY